MATKDNNNSPARSRPQTRLATARMLLENSSNNNGGSGAEKPYFVPPPPLFKPTNEYDRMMYEVFFCGDDGRSAERSATASNDNNNNNNRRRKSATRVSIMEPDTRAAATRKKKLLLNQATIPEKGEKAPTLKKDVNNTASGRVSGKRVLAAKDHFRLALNQRAKELGLPMNNKAVSSKKPKAQGKAKKKGGQKSNKNISSSSPCDIYAQSFSTYIPFGQKKNLVVYDSDDQPAVFIYADNLPKYEHKLLVLRGRGQAAKGAVKSGRGKTNSSSSASSTSVTPYQIGRMWADEHFPRALNKQRAEPPPPPPPPFPTDPASGGLYDEKEEEGEEYRCQQQHWGTAYLPPPEPAPVDPVTGHPINLRIPRAVRNRGCFSNNNRITDDQLLGEINFQTDRPISELLAENRRRWAAVRGEHLAAHQQNAARYHHTFAILEQIFRRQTLVVEEDRAEEAQEEEEEKEVSSGHWCCCCLTSFLYIFYFVFLIIYKQKSR